MRSFRGRSARGRGGAGFRRGGRATLGLGGGSLRCFSAIDRPRKSDRAGAQSRDLSASGRRAGRQTSHGHRSGRDLARQSTPISRRRPSESDFGGTTRSAREPDSASPTWATSSPARPYDDFVIGAPTVSSTPATIGTGINSAAYLVFGSQTITAAGMSTVTDWIGKNAASNVQLHAERPRRRPGPGHQPRQRHPTTQTNPITGTSGRFPVCRHQVRQHHQSPEHARRVGRRACGCRAVQGAILFGAPVRSTATSSIPARVGRTSSPAHFNNFIGETVNLDDPNFATDFPGLNMVTFVPQLERGGCGSAPRSPADRTSSATERPTSSSVLPRHGRPEHPDTRSPRTPAWST